ncbi:MAG: hypothetical protein FJ011_07025 [Chloroflexi bacterium]|nr:hypothetical protein [Chloroflexota bacterium]
MAISPYKGLAHARRYPGSQLVFGRWDAIARVDVVAGAGMRALPGLSYAYKSTPPPQLGLALDADALQPITLVAPGDFDAAAFLPEALAFELRPAGRVLVLASGGGLGVLQALAAGAQEATAVLEEPLARRAVAVTAAAHDPFAHPAVRTADEPSRVVLRRTQESYDVVYLPLTVPYRPVTSGAYSLAETYGLTREMFEDALGRLAPAGVLAVTRWLQTPPSESVRLMATLIEALERRGVSRPADALVAYRGIQTITVLARPDGWPAEDLEQVRQFTESRRYDLVWAPDVRPDELNRFNRLPAVADHEATVELLDAAQRSEFYRRYPYAVAPATDDRPFFFHFFRWGQTRQTLALLGRTWQPFGGSGYFVLFALLALALVLSIGLIVAPLAVSRTVTHATASAAGDETGHVPGTSEVPGTWGETRSISRPLLYFGLLGVAFLFVEIPLIQRWILAFGHATYAFAVVVFAVLVGAGAGSLAAHASWLPRRAVFPALIFLIVLTILGGPQLVRIALGWPLAGRVALAVASLAPLAFLMGLPFPLGLAWAEARRPAAASLIPWAWAVNGCASVIAAVLAAILALSFGFTAVLWLGAIGYAAAGVILTKSL